LLSTTATPNVTGGKFDLFANAGSFVILAFPAIVAVIAIVAFWGQSLAKITIIIGVAAIPVIFRVVRASALAFVNRDFVVAARTLGVTSSRIIFREILPNVIPIAVSFGLIAVAGVIVLEGELPSPLNPPSGLTTAESHTLTS
jgi:peptide/nickel transport system permease protein